MKRFLLIGLLFLLSGCLHAWVLPSTEIDLASKIPTEETYTKPSKQQDWQKKGISFVDQFYPESCNWVPLVRVVDGDTIIVNTKTRVRMLGIDAPESVIPNTPPEPFGKESSRILKDLLRDSNQVCLIQDPIGDKKDKYDRFLAYVFREDGLDVNARLIEMGSVKGYFRFPLSRTTEFKKLQSTAKRSKVGLWK